MEREVEDQDLNPNECQQNHDDHEEEPGSSSSQATPSDQPLTPKRILPGSSNIPARKPKATASSSSCQYLIAERLNLMKNIDSSIPQQQQRNHHQGRDDWNMIGDMLAMRLRHCKDGATRETVLEQLIFPAMAALKRD